MGSRARMARAFGVEPKGLLQEIQRRLRTPQRIVEISREQAPVQQVVLTGDAVDLRAGVRNLFDKDPPITDNNSAPASDINGNTFPNTYDAVGRVLYVGATIKL